MRRLPSKDFRLQNDATTLFINGRRKRRIISKLNSTLGQKESEA